MYSPNRCNLDLTLPPLLGLPNRPLTKVNNDFHITVANAFLTSQAAFDTPLKFFFWIPGHFPGFVPNFVCTLPVSLLAYALLSSLWISVYSKSLSLSLYSPSRGSYCYHSFNYQYSNSQIFMPSSKHASEFLFTYSIADFISLIGWPRGTTNIRWHYIKYSHNKPSLPPEFLTSINLYVYSCSSSNPFMLFFPSCHIQFKMQIILPLVNILHLFISISSI